MNKIGFKTPTTDLFMIGQAYSQKLKKLNIHTVKDLFYHFPSRYRDFRLISEISQIQPGEVVTVVGKITNSQNIYTRTRKRIQKVVIKDKTGQIEAVWFNQPFLIKTLKSGQLVAFSGKVDHFGYKKTLNSPEYELIKPAKTKGMFLQIHTARLVPIYPETRGVSSKWLRSRIAPLIETLGPKMPEFLPASILKKYHLEKLGESLRKIHFPQTLEEIKQARTRLAFEEMFLIQLAALERKKTWQKKQPPYLLKVDQEKVLAFIDSFPFELTKAQKRAVKEILKDLGGDKPMNRLLQGDVGSGKTVVAAVAIYVAFLNGTQAALMAPTEILALQHYQTLKTLLKAFGLKIELLTSSTKKQAPTANHQPPDLIIGTQALLYNSFQPKEMALVVIDEQHRFGVSQRNQLLQKASQTSQKIFPHLLTMTATPIPRTVTLTLYGDLDLSIIDEMPHGRQKIKTWIVPPQKREGAYDWIKKQVKEKKSQAFIVCPLIEESQAETLKDVRAATVEFERLKKVFKKLKLGLLHGRLKSIEKKTVIEAFQQGKIQILVSTPVVEVGIDIPNATIMMIEAAERFGLAQLHQLRGRVGRGKKQSYCLIFSTSTNRQPLQRLRCLEKIYLGAKLAEIDLKLRGPGEVYGLKQHGFFNLKLAQFNDEQLIKKTRAAAESVIDQLKQLKPLKSRLKQFKISLILPN